METERSTVKTGMRTGKKRARHCSAGITNQTAVREQFKGGVTSLYQNCTDGAGAKLPVREFSK